MAARIVILTGGRGVGKTTVCRRAIVLAQAGQYTCGGILTLSRLDGGREVLDVGSGDVCPLTIAPDASPAVIQGRFRFDPATLAWANEALARIQACDLLVVDELGPLEIERGAGWSKAFEVLREASFALALVVVRPELVVQAQLRLPTSATNVFTVTVENRDTLPEVLVDMLGC